MNLIRTSVYTSISTAVTFISGFIVTKVVATKIGPSGIAFVGQFQNSIAILSILATGAITTGVIKYMANYQQDIDMQKSLLSTALKVILISSFVISSFVILFSTHLSSTAFKTTEFWPVFVMYGIFLTLISLNTFFLSVFNGLKQIKNITIINISSSLIGIVFTVTLANYYGVKGVLVASNFTAIVVFCLNLWFLRKLEHFSWRPNFKKWDKNILKMLFAFTLMTAASGFLTPLTQLLIRSKIIENFSTEEAGYWQAVTRISDYYLAFITTVLGVYYLPKLSEINEKAELRHEVISGYRLILPVVAAMALAIWLCRGLIVEILFSEKFLPMLPLFKFQLLGDFLKIGSWLLGFIMISKAWTKMFLITEVIFNLIIVGLSYLFIDMFGIIGATYAFCINYALYWITMGILMKKYIF